MSDPGPLGRVAEDARSLPLVGFAAGSVVVIARSVAPSDYPGWPEGGATPFEARRMGWGVSSRMARSKSPSSRQRVGDVVSRKQLERTVIDGRAITLHLPDAPVRGYVCGIDSYHWMVVTPEAEKYLVHKSAASMVRLHDEETYRSEPKLEELEHVVKPFRDFVIRCHHRSHSQEGLRR